MKRVMIIGAPGSGKSTLARRIGAATGLPVYHMDQIHWQSGWVQRPRPLRVEMAHAVENAPEWVFEGGFSTTYAHRLSRCDTLIFLDLPVWLRAWRVARRTLRHYGRNRPDLPEGCPERFSAEFWRWIWTTRTKNRNRDLELLGTAGPDVTIHHLRSPRAVRRYLTTL